MSGSLSPGTDTLLSLLGVWLIGSALAILTTNTLDRIPRHQSWTSPKPYCRSCAAALKWTDLIPVWSYLRSHGKCPYCGEPWPRRQIIIEIAEIAWVAIFIARFGWSYPAIITLIFGVGLIVITVLEFESGVLSDLLLVIMGSLGVIYILAFQRTDFPNALTSLTAGGAVLFIYNVLRKFLSARHRADINEIKFAAVLGLFLGLPKILTAILLAGLLETLWGVIYTYMLTREPQIWTPRFPALLSLSGLFVILYGDNLIGLFQGIVGRL